MRRKALHDKACNQFIVYNNGWSIVTFAPYFFAHTLPQRTLQCKALQFIWWMLAENSCFSAGPLQFHLNHCVLWYLLLIFTVTRKAATVQAPRSQPCRSSSTPEWLRQSQKWPDSLWLSRYIDNVITNLFLRLKKIRNDRTFQKRCCATTLKAVTVHGHTHHTRLRNVRPSDSTAEQL